ncbi:MAG: 3-hydroxyacyl-CoA dehydrogenase NAD-binding domain-containing protein [Methylorubrum populi]
MAADPRSPTQPTVRREDSDGIALLTIDRPDRSMNVLEPGLVAELRAAFEAAVSDEAVSGIVITSGKVGEKPSFIAGADLGQMEALGAAGRPARAVTEAIDYLGGFFRRIETCGKPVVGAAPGTALGGGLELLLATHHRIFANEPDARYGLPEVKLGLLPGAGGTQRLPRLVGIAASLPLLLQGRDVGGAEAVKAGLAHEAVPAAEVVAAARAALAGGKVDPAAPWDRKGFRLPGGGVYDPKVTGALVAANAGTHAATQGNYPAPLAILRCVYEGTKLPIDRALRLEQKHFATLVQGRPAQNMIRTLFFAKQAADKLARRPAAAPKRPIRRLGVLGAGFMGAGVAQVSALAGMEVVLVDRTPEIAARARASILAQLEAEQRKGRLSETAREAAAARITAGADHAAFSGCDMVIEAVLEDFEVKRTAIRATEAALGPDAIFASNTSALPIDELAQASARPENLIGLHFFSPVPRMALVEVVVGAKTSDATLARALDYVRAIRKTPIVVRDGYGFYTTRCVDAYIREGLRCVADGVDPVLIENAGAALGMPVGPLALVDEVGIDVMHHIAHFFRARETGPAADDRHTVNALLDALVAERRFGRKTRTGFYAYPADAPKRLDRTAVADLARGARSEAGAAEIRERLLYAQLVEAARCWDAGIIDEAGEADLGAILGWAFPSYLGGPLAAIDDIGAGAFAERCAALSRAHGARFDLPDAFAKAERRLYGAAA